MTAYTKKYSFLLLLLFGTSTFCAGQNTPNWSDQIACLVYSHCSGCHQDNGIAPFPLLTYQDVYDYRFSIEDVITRKYMPPWPADPNYSHFQNENVLTNEEIAMFTDWVNNGAPTGDLGKAPSPPNSSKGSLITNPDLVLNLPVYEVPPLADNDLYRCFVFDLDLPQDIYITAFEVIPGNPAIVHHALVYQSSSSRIDDLDRADPDPGYVCFGGIGVADVKGIGGWVPGNEATFFPAGMGMKIPGKTKIVVQVHYPEYGAGEVDSTKVLFKYTSVPQREIFNDPILHHGNGSLTNGPLFIPANTVKSFQNEYRLPIKATIYSVTPHAHLICESMKSYAVTPSGDTIHIIDIPKWDFDWQKTYHFKAPIVLPFGSKLYGFATYNNTSSNPHNPSVPPKNVRLGEATTDEMMLFYFNYSAYRNGDENIVFDDSEHFAHYDDCDYQTSTSIDAINKLIQVEVIPNPAKESIKIRSDHTIQSIRMMSVYDQSVMSWSGNQKQVQLEVSQLVNGVYYLIIESNRNLISKTCVVQK